MVNPIPMKKLWIHNAIQFGFIAFFALSFPAAAIIGLVINLFHINFLYFSFTDHLKRRPSVERGSIGVWNNIFIFMSFTSLVINIAILMFSSDGLEELLDQTKSFDFNNPINVITALIIAEHIIFLVKFLITIFVADKPAWVKSYLYEQEYKKQLDDERSKKKMLKKLNKMNNMKPGKDGKKPSKGGFFSNFGKKKEEEEKEKDLGYSGFNFGNFFRGNNETDKMKEE